MIPNTLSREAKTFMDAVFPERNGRQLFMPYVLCHNGNYNWTLLNREYKPLSIFPMSGRLGVYADPREEGFRFKMFLTRQEARKHIDNFHTEEVFQGHWDTDHVYFYYDGTDLSKAKPRQEYFDRLAFLMKKDIWHPDDITTGAVK